MRNMLKNKHFQRSSTLLLLAFTALLSVGNLAGDIENTPRRAGAITGRVVEGRTGDGVPLVEIQVWSESGQYLDAALTDMNGLYEIEGLAAGRYFAGTLESGFRDELYSGAPCPFGDCDPTLGTPIEVQVGAVTSGVDFTLTR